jgi:hypothetical protein
VKALSSSPSAAKTTKPKKNQKKGNEKEEIKTF